MKSKLFNLCILLILLIFVISSSEREVSGDENISLETPLEEEVIAPIKDPIMIKEDNTEMEEFMKLKEEILLNRKNISDITNILVIGEENVYEDDRGRSDLMMIVSLDKKNNKVKVVSLLRDMLVDIKGYNKNKLNASYAFGGVELLEDTIENNLLIDINYYVKVNFNNFEDIIDTLGGVDIELTSEESEYLNTTNYISNEEYRNTVTGLNHFNGNQALGYSRVRHVPAINGELYDFGRTFRQRTILKEIYNEFKNQNLFTIAKVSKDIFKSIETDIPYMDALSMVFIVKDLNFEDVKMYRIPVDGKFESITYNDLMVLKFDKENIKILDEYIYGNEEKVNN